MHLLRVVDVVDQVLDNGRGVGGLHALAVVGDDRAGRGADNDGALLALYTMRQLRLFCGYVLPSQAVPGVATFLPYRLRSSALIETNFSPPTEKPLAKALSLEVKAEARELMSSWES